MKVIGYCWAEEVVEGDKPAGETVPQSIQLYAERHRWPVRIQFERPDYAFTEFAQRPWGRELLGMLRPGDILLVPDPSYLFRTPGHGRVLLETLIKKKVAAHCMDCGEDLTSQKGAAALMSVLHALEGFETQMSAVRMRSRKRQHKTEGRYLGGNPPFGFTANKDGKLRPDTKKLQALNLMKKRRTQGASLRAIAAEVAKKGIKISHSGVASALKSATIVTDGKEE
jgi:DNA invertase Pin-like site-specific DNA recombinase